MDVVLQHRAGVFQHSAGCTATFAEDVDRLDAFLSHTWSTPRWKTFMALSLYYNVRTALVAAVLAGVAISVCVACGMLPVVDVSGVLRSAIFFAPYATVVVSLVFQVAMHVGHEVLPKFLRVFLDKLCIHQRGQEAGRCFSPRSDTVLLVHHGCFGLGVLLQPTLDGVRAWKLPGGGREQTHRVPASEPAAARPRMQRRMR